MVGRERFHSLARSRGSYGSELSLEGLVQERGMRGFSCKEQLRPKEIHS